MRKKHPLYNVWCGMNQRCHYEKSKGYHNYGGRGIKVCEEWNKSNPKGFENFCEYVGERPKGLQMDRIDNDGNYEPGNIRWVTCRENLENRRIPETKYRKTSLEEEPGTFGNWFFTGKIERRYDSRGISNRYYEVKCLLCGRLTYSRKQDVKTGKSKKCKSCSSTEMNINKPSSSLKEEPGTFGNWYFTGNVERRYDPSGNSIRYYEVKCTLCGIVTFSRKQNIKNGVSTKCRACSYKKRDGEKKC